DRVGPAAGTRGPVHMQRPRLEADGFRGTAVVGTGGDAQAYLIRLGSRWQFAMYAGIADQVDLQLRVDEPALLEPRLHDLGSEPGAGDRVRAAERHLPLADVAVEVADGDLVGRCARTALGARHRHAVPGHLLQPYAGDVDHAVGRDV